MTKRIFSGVFLASLISAPAMAADLPSRTPGLWQSTTTVTGPDGQPVANAVNVVTVSCVDVLNDQKFFTSYQSACSSLTISGKGNSYSIDGTCSRQGETAKIHETLIYSGPQALQLKAVYDGDSGKMTVTSQLQWQGNCLPGMQPGDEGNIAGGVFTQTDNINDSLNQ
jgi:hypothetical protein